jgi:hypothetical protein
MFDLLLTGQPTLTLLTKRWETYNITSCTKTTKKKENSKNVQKIMWLL